MSVFEVFETGKLFLASGQQVDLEAIQWSFHPAFEGVALKHLITAKETEGAFSYHLVRIAPQKAIGWHSHETQLETHEIISGNGECHTAGKKLAYESGTLSVLPAGIEHEVIAGEQGLFLFAKFFPALC